MDRYCDITILPDPEFSSHSLMNELFARLHLALHDLQSSDIGVSFPHVNAQRPCLGDLLRLHGSDAALSALLRLNWLGGVRDHISLGSPALTPGDVQHRTVRRVQSKSNPERLRRRYAKRHNMNIEEARVLIPDTSAKLLRLPFLSLRSRSTGQPFRLFVEHGPLCPEPTAGSFSQYGLSAGASVPWF